MSVLETPRIYFRGQVAWDPITTNNYDTFYDETDAEPIYPKAVKKVQAFRQEAINAVLPQMSWNPHGTHRSHFFDSAVSGADLGSGLVIDDPFVASPALFMGMLVDLEPFGAFSSQLFFDGMTFGIDGGYRIAAPRSMRFTDRYINFTRTAVGAIAGVASVVWQASFPKEDGLRIDAFDSPALQALQKALQAKDVLGLTVQWNTYRTVYYNNEVTGTGKLAPWAAALTKKLDGGGWQPNPARSVMVGVIGLWRDGEPPHEPLDRTLITGPDDPPGPPNIGSAYARVNADSIVLDLSNSISETDLCLTKANFGDLSVVAVPSTGAPVTLATFGYDRYDKDAYEATSGIVTLQVDPANAKIAATADLQLRDSSNQVYLAEAALRALPLVPNLYINQGDTPTAWMQVYDRGVKAGAGIEVTLCTMSADGGTIDSQQTLTTDANGMVSFQPAGANAGINAYVPVPGPDPALPSQGINPLVNTYMYVRVLPADENIAAMAPTWENVYCYVLANWHAMAPCMDNWLNLGNEAQVRAFASLIKTLTAETAFENFMYMPVTRDLTPGERTLLYTFLDSPPTAAVAEAMLKVPKPQPPRFVKLSKRMRGTG